MTLELAFQMIKDANRFEDLIEPTEDRAKAYKRLAFICHPDHNPSHQAEAHEAMSRLSLLYDGNLNPTVKIGKWSVQDPLARGDIANLYNTIEGAIFKIVRNQKDNDLMDRERLALEMIHAEDVRFRHYIPQLQEALTASGRRANVINAQPEFVTLEFIASKLGGHIDFRHVVWMMNRMLSMLGYVHRKGLIHGALVPCHILYKLADHDSKIVDWCYSTKIGGTVPAAVSRFRSLYAPEILLKLPVHASTDLYMAAKTIQSVTTVPQRFRPLFAWCLAESPAARPKDCWEFQDLWRSKAKETFGEPKFQMLSI